MKPLREKPISVFVMDFSCVVPYYTGPLCEALHGEGIDVALGSIDYRCDSQAFARHHVRPARGIVNLTSKWTIASALRRPVKLVENIVNLLLFAGRLMVRPPRIVHVQFLYLIEHHVRLEVWALKLAKAMGSKIVHTVHNVLPMETGMRHKRTGLRYKKTFSEIYRLADRLICHNEGSAGRLQREFAVAPEKISIIPHGPLFSNAARPDGQAARARFGFAPSDCVVVWQGVIDYYKGVPFLLDAWRKVRVPGIKATLVIAGAGQQELMDEIRRKAADAGMRKTVRLELRFLPVDELAALLQAADILVYPYREITTSGALMTAVGYHKAMIVSDLPLFRETLVNGESALLSPYGDVDGLAAQLDRLIAQPEERRRLQEGVSRIAARQTSWSEIASLTRACYEQTLAIPSAVETRRVASEGA